ncbi:MAG: hypothetical protein IH614_03090 [Desulfuromonadales bacterium]|nr:hypothetical protein [Desulfuromonadales bacterium]
MKWYQRSLSFFLLAFGLAVFGLILGDLSLRGALPDSGSFWPLLRYPGYLFLVGAVLASLFSLYAGVRAWTAERQLCWWIVVPLLMVAAFLYQWTVLGR